MYLWLYLCVCVHNVADVGLKNDMLINRCAYNNLIPYPVRPQMNGNICIENRRFVIIHVICLTSVQMDCAFFRAKNESISYNIRVVYISTSIHTYCCVFVCVCLCVCIMYHVRWMRSSLTRHYYYDHGTHQRWRRTATGYTHSNFCHCAL